MDEWKPIRDVMTTDVETIEPDALMTDAARKMSDTNIGSLVIVDENESPTGIISQTDIVEFAAELESITGNDIPPVREWMATDVVTVSRDSVFEEVVKKLVSNDIHHLPVVDNGELVGIVTTTDLGTVFSSAP